MKKMIRVVLLFVAAMIVVGCLRRDYIARGEQAMAAENYQTAEIYFKKAIQRDPHSDRAYYELGTLYLKEQDYRFSYAAFSRAADLNPRNGAARVEAGKILLAVDQPAQAEHEAREALHYEPHLLPASLLLGEALTAEAHMDTARETLEQAVREHPRSSDGYLALAELESKEQNSQRTLDNLDRAIAADPHNPHAWRAKAIYLFGHGESQQAVAVLHRAIELNPSSDELKTTLGEMLLNLHQISEGIALMRSVADSGSGKTVARAQLAIAEIDAHQLAAAAADLKKLPQGAASQPLVLYARARLSLAQNKIADAQHLLLDVTDIAPKFEPGFYYLGIAYMASGDLQKAKAQLETAAKLAPDRPEIYLMLGNIELKQGYYPAALEDSERSLQYAPDNLPALRLKADALFAAGRVPEAKQVYEQLAALAPEDSAVHEQLGILAIRQKDFKTAVREFEAALSRDPGRASSLNDLALVLQKTEGQQAALDRIREQIMLQPNNADFHTILAVFLMNDHQPDAAADELKTAIKKAPDQSALYFVLARLYQSEHKVTQAEAELKLALAKKPDYVPNLMLLGALADEQGHFDEAIGYYQKLVAVAPNFGAAANNLAYDYLRQDKDLDQALDLAQRARQLMPHDPQVADTLGEAFLKRGLPSNAVPLFRESIQANAKNANPHYHLGFALLALKQDSAASEELNTALKLAPNANEAGKARQALAQIAKTEPQAAK
jgi:tetratricopeptide (TPR) repeat protein